MSCLSQVSAISSLGQLRGFTRRHHPADYVPAEDVQDDIEIEVGPLGRPLQLGDVPTPKLVRRSGQQLRPLICRMGELITTFASFTLLFEDPVHRAERAVIDALVQQRGEDRGRRAILKAFLMQTGKHRIPLRQAERARRNCFLRWAESGALLSIVRSPGEAKNFTSGLSTNRRGQLVDGCHQNCGSRSVVQSGRPNRAATFF